MTADVTSGNVSEELLVVPVPLDAVQGVAHHLVVAEEGEVLPHLGHQRPPVTVTENHHALFRCDKKMS